MQRERIIASAAEHFGRLGFAGASLRAIATEIGVSHTSLVQLFGTKEKLLIAVLEAWDEDLSAELRGQRGLAFLEALSALVARHRERRGIVELFLRMSVEATDPDHPAREYIRARSERVRGLLAAAISEAVSDGDLHSLTKAQVGGAARELVAAMNGLELNWLLGEDFDLAEQFDSFLRRWLDALR